MSRVASPEKSGTPHYGPPASPGDNALLNTMSIFRLAPAQRTMAEAGQPQNAAGRLEPGYPQPKVADAVRQELAAAGTAASRTARFTGAGEFHEFTHGVADTLRPGWRLRNHPANAKNRGRSVPELLEVVHDEALRADIGDAVELARPELQQSATLKIGKSDNRRRQKSAS